MIAQVYFYAFSAIALVCAIGVVASRHPIHGALSLIGTMVSLAGIYSLVDSPFLATLQILVYAGAIMMLLVFVIMVLNSAKDDKTPWWDAWGFAAAAPALATGAVLLKLVLGSDRARHVEPDAQALRGTVANISTTLFPDRLGGWALLFLVVGLLLLSAIVGAVLLAKRRLDSPAVPAHSEGGH